MTLKDFFEENSKVAIAFSGGVDSAFLLYSAKKYGADAKAYYAKSAFQPEFELEDAKRLAEELGVPMRILHLDVLASSEVTSNPKNRCYYCKRLIFTEIVRAAKEDGYSVLLDGTNASDDASDRPGMKALEELSVLSPLALCGLTKDEIRAKSKDARLFTWDKPAYACLATRIPTGTEIDAQKLASTEAAEGYLFFLGFSDFRIRYLDGAAKLQLTAADIPRLLENREGVLAELKKYYKDVLLDLQLRG